MKKFSFLPAIAGLMLLVAACGESSFDRNIKMDEVPCANCAGVPDADGDGSPTGVDCDDTDARRTPGKPEVCDDDIDNDCDRTTDEGCGSDAPVDTDGDGHADVADCAPTDRTVWANCGAGGSSGCEDGLVDTDGDQYCFPGGLDCDDGNPAVHPGAPEVCNDGLDSNCNGLGGGLGQPEDASCIPGGSPDADHDGFTVAGGDCDDTVAAINPGATELCNGLNDDCDGAVDEGNVCNPGGTASLAFDYAVAAGDQGVRDIHFEFGASREELGRSGWSRDYLDLPNLRSVNDLMDVPSNTRCIRRSFTTGPNTWSCMGNSERDARERGVFHATLNGQRITTTSFFFKTPNSDDGCEIIDCW